MKIAVRGGHNYSVPGAKGIIDEVVEDRKVYKSVMKYLLMAGHKVLDVTSSIADINEELADGVTKANDWGADIFISIHFNNCYKTYNGAIGTEVWCNINNSDAAKVGKRIVNNLATTGLKNRGIKDGLSARLYEIRATKMTGIIVEVAFVEATEDCIIYNSVGSDKIGLLIAEAIHGGKITDNPSQNVTCDNTRPTGDSIYPIGKHSYIEETADGRTILHNDRGNYITIGKGFIDLFWNDNNGHSGSKRISG